MQVERQQARGAALYERSERALKWAIAEMYINGVSNRRVSEIVEKLCGGTTKEAWKRGNALAI